MIGVIGVSDLGLVGTRVGVQEWCCSSIGGLGMEVLFICQFSMNIGQI